VLKLFHAARKGITVTKSKKKSTSSQIDPDLKRQLDHALTDRDVKFKVAVTEGLHLWIAGRPKYPDEAATLPDADKTLLMAFPRFLREASEGSAWAVRKIIEGWLGRQPPPKPKR
jgi:hypothetical protein